MQTSKRVTRCNGHRNSLQLLLLLSCASSCPQDHWVWNQNILANTNIASAIVHVQLCNATPILHLYWWPIESLSGSEFAILKTSVSWWTNTDILSTFARFEHSASLKDFLFSRLQLGRFSGPPSQEAQKYIRRGTWPASNLLIFRKYSFWIPL